MHFFTVGRWVVHLKWIQTNTHTHFYFINIQQMHFFTVSRWGVQLKLIQTITLLLDQYSTNTLLPVSHWVVQLKWIHTNNSGRACVSQVCLRKAVNTIAVVATLSWQLWGLSEFIIPYKISLLWLFIALIEYYRSNFLTFENSRTVCIVILCERVSFMYLDLIELEKLWELLENWTIVRMCLSH